MLLNSSKTALSFTLSSFGLKLLTNDLLLNNLNKFLIICYAEIIMGKNITIKSKVIIVVSVIIAIITIAAIISSYNIFYKNIFATSKLTQYN